MQLCRSYIDTPPNSLRHTLPERGRGINIEAPGIVIGVYIFQYCKKLVYLQRKIVIHF